MLVEATRPIRGFLEFLNQKKMCETPCQVVLLPDNDTIEGKGEGNVGFAAYCPATMVIYVAGDTSRLVDIEPEERFDIVLENVAHEYVHHLQNMNTGEFDEEEAETLATELVKEYAKVRMKRIHGKGTGKTICINGCGEFEVAYKKIPSKDHKTYFKAKVIYCPECFCIHREENCKVKTGKDCCPLYGIRTTANGLSPLAARCIRESCAWWNEEYQQCAVLTLAQQARPQKVRISCGSLDALASATKEGGSE